MVVISIVVAMWSEVWNSFSTTIEIIIESPISKHALCEDKLNLAKWFWRKRWKREKFTHKRTDGRTMDNQKSSLELQFRWAKIKKKITLCTEQVHLSFPRGPGLLASPKKQYNIKCLLNYLLIHNKFQNPQLLHFSNF